MVPQPVLPVQSGMADDAKNEIIVAISNGIAALAQPADGDMHTETWVIFADIDTMKSLNDQVGYEAGNAAIRQVGNTLQNFTGIRGCNVCCRIGLD